MKNLMLLLIMVIVISCAPIYVNYDYEKGTDFTKYQTYNYYSDIETGFSELDTRRFLDALDSSLQSKGMRLSETPDFYINIKSHEYINNQQSNVGVGIGGSGRNVGGGVSIGIPVGQSKMSRQIQIDFIDENANGLFWQAVSENSYNLNASPDKKEIEFKAITEKVLSQYPPKRK